jgi:hypothetical protein
VRAYYLHPHIIHTSTLTMRARCINTTRDELGRACLPAGTPLVLLVALLADGEGQHAEAVRQLLLKSPALKKGLTSMADTWLDVLQRGTHVSSMAP